jgi:alpha-tubulin suppressor-like RCC1 family protein
MQPGSAGLYDCPRVGDTGGVRTTACVAFVVLAGCGRIGFDARTGDGSPGDDVANDAAPVGFSHLVAYADSTCAMFRGAAYCWGSNASGQLGIVTVGPQVVVPTPVPLPAGTVDDLALGANHGCAIVSGALYCYGVLGNGTDMPVALPDTPTVVRAGNNFTCTIAGGNVYCWGSSAGQGQLAVGDTNPRAAPTATLLGPTTAISIGDDHGCAIETGVGVCWGHNDYGTLGTGSMNPASSPSPVAVRGGRPVLPQIAGWHACDLDAGTVRCWGEGDHGELGDGAMVSDGSPRTISSLASVTALAVGGGPADGDASCAVVAGGDVQCWGRGLFGRLGQGMAQDSAVPVDVASLPAPATDLAIGYDHACALVVGGDVWCWGRGDSGQLGDGQAMNSLVPVRVVRPP